MKERIKIVHVRRTPIIIASFLLLALGITTYIVSYSEYVSKLNGESSGVVDNVVYIMVPFNRTALVSKIIKGIREENN
jgi:hypothetical protein